MENGLSYYVSPLMRVGVDFVIQGHLGGKFSTFTYLVNGLHVNLVLCIHSSTDNRNRIGGPGKWLYSCQCRELEEQ